jgi:2-polyprenyl-6-methoxyphenol hydroxylase-like FAD-dependent oxidoreductase
MTQRILDIAVAGCGPAGLGVALMLHRAGHRVALFHQFEQPGAVGSGLILQPTGLAVLAELGLAERILGLGQRIDRLFGRACPSQRIVLDVDYAHLGRQAFGVAVHRGALFTTLYEAALRAGLAFETGWRVAGIERLAGSRTRLVRADSATAGPFDLVIDALGTRSALRPAFGAQPLPPDLPYGALWASLPWDGRNFDPHALEQRYERASVMVGVLPIGRTLDRPEPLAAFFWSLKPAAYEAWQREGLAAWKSRIFDLWPETLSLLDRIQDPDALTLAR